MGTVNAVKAGFNGLRGVFLHLAEEHGEVASLMKRIDKSTDAQGRREHWSQIRAELLSHERAEVAEVYPALRGFDSTRELVVIHDQEARQLEAAIAAVDACDPSSEAWGSAFKHVFALVQQHVEEEESDFFPKAQEVLGEEESKALLQRYEAAKKSAKSQS